MYVLLVLLLITHWLADYTHLSTKWMLNAKAAGRPWPPIFAHAAVHAVLVLAVLVAFVDLPRALGLALFQLVSHFLIDLGKGKISVCFPVLKNPCNQWHWYLFGLDQLLHQIVLVIISAAALTGPL
jgi:hypothetical protein